MDLEESLQLDSTEDVNGNVNGGANINTMEEVAPEVVHEAEQKVKDTKIAAVEEIRRKRHLNCVFIGHVDAGKSTTAGQALLLSGQVHDGTIQRPHFETVNTRFTILDAPRHTSYVPHMISWAAQADIGVLVISARRGEFETDFERGGHSQTREHVQLVKALDVSKLIVVVNKMDDPTVEWSQERYAEIQSRMVPFLESSGYNMNKDVQFLPISALIGSNIANRMETNLCPWWSGPCLFEALDEIEVPDRDPNGPFRMPIIDNFKFKDTGTLVVGKVECGSVSEGDSLLVMPNKTLVKVIEVYCDLGKVRSAVGGENVRVRMSGVEEEDILSGFVLCSVPKPIATATEFVAQLQILELPDNDIFTAGYKAVLHIYAVVEECECLELIHQIHPKTRKPVQKKIIFAKNNALVVCRLRVNNLICIEKYSDFPKLGRFILRTERKTIAVGKVTDLQSTY